jgi:hypothetical protein
VLLSCCLACRFFWMSASFRSGTPAESPGWIMRGRTGGPRRQLRLLSTPVNHSTCQHRPDRFTIHAARVLRTSVQSALLRPRLTNYDNQRFTGDLYPGTASKGGYLLDREAPIGRFRTKGGGVFQD